MPRSLPSCRASSCSRRRSSYPAISNASRIVGPTASDATDFTSRVDLSGLPELEDARVEVSDYEFEATPGPEALITHRIEVSGGDQLGLIARLAEVFREYGTNIVRLEAQKTTGSGGDRYVTRFAVSIPPARAEICLSAVANTAGSLRLDCNVEEV